MTIQNNRKVRIAVNILLITLTSFVAVALFLLISNFQGVVFAIRRPDIIGAAMKVEAEENKMIQSKIAEARRDTVKKILSPLVTKSN